MTEIQIEYINLYKAISNIGGFQSVILSVYTLILSFIYPNMFYNRIAKYFFKREKDSK